MQDLQYIEFMEAVKRDCMYEILNEFIRVPVCFKVYVIYLRKNSLSQIVRRCQRLWLLLSGEKEDKE